ncbi:MAG: hypothetical protein ABIZ80_18125 [Bryobacteraceae bacterium]
MALRLRRLGIASALPLAGGFEAWRSLDLPVEEVKRGAVLVSWWG